MNKEIVALIDAVINDLDTTTLIALYEFLLYRDYDYIENLFPTKQEFKEFIEKFKEGEE